MEQQRQDLKYKIIDLFAGAGGLSNGFLQTEKFEILGAVEINKAAAKTYAQNHNKNENVIIKSKDNGKSDISKIDFYQYIKENNIAGEDIVVIGGPPCQGFSKANRQKNYLISGNNQLVKQYVRAIDEIKPKAFLLENVKSIDSDIHKFFVTKHIEGSIFAYSSEKHLSLISENNPEKLEDFVKDDIIKLVETKYSSLSHVFELVINEVEIKPIIENETYISRLRSIERKINKQKYYQISTEKEKKEILKIIEFLNKKIKEDDIIKKFQIDLIISSAIDLLKKIIDYQVDQIEALNSIEPLIDLNRFLLHYNELLEEKIVYKKPLKINKSQEKISVLANVKSYNVVQYLKNVFAYYGYEYDDKVLDASNFGVPQRRQRFMMLGVQKKFARGQNIDLPQGITWFNETKNTTYHAISELEDISPQQDINKYLPIPYKENSNLSPLQLYYRKNNKLIYNHINTNSNSLSLERFKAIKEKGGKNFHSLSDELKTTYTDSARTQNTIYLRLNYFEPSPTVVNVRKSMWNHPKNAVALSIREAARLQSFRDNFVFYGTKDQQYQQVGNAVPPLLARSIAEQLLKILGDNPIIKIEDELCEKVSNSC